MKDPVVPPDNPTSAVLIRLEVPDRPNIFSFLICFPRDARFDSGRTGVQLTVTSRPIKPHETLSSELEVAKGYGVYITEELIKRGRFDLIDRTHWPSVLASISHEIEEFESKRPHAPRVIQ